MAKRKIRMELDPDVWGTIDRLSHSEYPDDAYALRAIIRDLWDDKAKRMMDHLIYSGMATAKTKEDREAYEGLYAERRGGRLMREIEERKKNDGR